MDVLFKKLKLYFGTTNINNCNNDWKRRMEFHRVEQCRKPSACFPMSLVSCLMLVVYVCNWADCVYSLM